MLFSGFGARASSDDSEGRTRTPSWSAVSVALLCYWLAVKIEPQLERAAGRERNERSVRFNAPLWPLAQVCKQTRRRARARYGRALGARQGADGAKLAARA